MPSKKPKQSVKKQNNRTTVSKIKGGAVYGSGAYGVVVSDPAIPVNMPHNTRLLSRIKTTIKSKLNKNNKLVSKLFFQEEDIPEALKAIEFLKAAAGNETIEEVFGKYLFLPYKQIDGRYVADINLSEYTSPKFQNDRYWLKINPENADDSAPKTDLRDKLKNATQQIQYVKATCGTLDDFKIRTLKDFSKFLLKFKNVINGIVLLHSKDLVHHDLKPPNILCKTIRLKRNYLISDLDTIRPVDNFNMVAFNSEDNDHIIKLLGSWTYDYWPSCITLLYSCMKSTNNIISDYESIYYSEHYISEGLKNPDYISQCQSTFKYLSTAISQVIPDSTVIQGYLSKIFNYRYGSDKINDDVIDKQTGKVGNKYKDALVANNRTIAYLLSNRGLSSDDIRNILLKYVDIYSLCMTIIDMLCTLFKNSQGNLELDDIETRRFENLFLFLYICMTNEYFKMKLYQFPIRNDRIKTDDDRYLYEVPITDLYDATVAGFIRV